MRKFLLGLFLGLLAVVHSTPVTTVTKVPISNEDEVFREAMTDGFLVPSLSTETPKTQSTIEASQQTESTSSADDASRDSLLTAEAPKTNATVPASQQPDSEKIEGSTGVADNFWHGGYTTMTSTLEAFSATESTTTTSTLEAFSATETTTTTSTLEAFSATETTTTTSTQEASSVTETTTSTQEASSATETTTSTQEVFGATESTTMASTQEASSATETTTSMQEASSATETTTSTQEVFGATESTTMASTQEASSATETTTSTQKVFGATESTTTTSTQEASGATKSTTSEFDPNELPAETTTVKDSQQLFSDYTLEGSASGGGEDMSTTFSWLGSSTTSTSTDSRAISLSPDSGSGDDESILPTTVDSSGSDLGSGMNKEETNMKAEGRLYNLKEPEKVVEKQDPEQHKGHSTPGWIIIVGFIVGVAALVVLCLAIATRDKWNGPRQASTTKTETNPLNQQKGLEMETFLPREEPRENGKAAEYTVIPLDELSESYS